jgi:hypothetical protein
MTDRSTLDFATRVKILDALRLVCTKDDDGFALYAEGNSDKSVADALKDDGVALSNVAGVRKQMFGNLRRGGNDNIFAETQARLVTLDGRVVAILARLSAIESAVTRLMKVTHELDVGMKAEKLSAIGKVSTTDTDKR